MLSIKTGTKDQNLTSLELAESIVKLQKAGFKIPENFDPITAMYIVGKSYRILGKLNFR